MILLQSLDFCVILCCPLFGGTFTLRTVFNLLICPFQTISQLSRNTLKFVLALRRTKPDNGILPLKPDNTLGGKRRSPSSTYTNSQLPKIG